MKPIKIAFLIVPQIHLLDLAGVDQVFHEAKDYGANINLQYSGVFVNNYSSTNFPIGKLMLYNKLKLQAGDYLFIPGADVDYLLSPEITKQYKLFTWINQQKSNGVIICSICTGAFLLAHTGLLNNKSCTTHWKRTAQLKELFPLVKLQENILFCEDDEIYTSAGVTAGIDLALHIVGKIKDENFAFKIARELVVYNRRKGNDAQQSECMKYRNHIHNGVHAVQDYIQEHLNTPFNITDLADIALMSSRNLTRIFKKETGLSINEYVTILRVETLNELKNNPDLSVQQMANKVGLKSERQVMRLLKK